jgi:hypothetical protein
MKQFDGPPLWVTGTPRIAGPEPNAAIVEINRHRESPDRPRPAATGPDRHCPARLAEGPGHPPR